MKTRIPRALAITLAVAGTAHAAGLDPVWGALGETKPIVDARLRMENVDQAPIANDAHAVTLRMRLGFETGKAWNTSLLVEGEGIVPIQGNYRIDPTIPKKTTYPLVPDAETYEFNRLQLMNTSIPGTTITLGRQRIGLDDQRFVGGVAWRQNEQTFDALRVVNKSIANLTLDASYVNQVNRVFGRDSRQGHYTGDNLLLNAGYQTKVGKITAFSYLLDIENIVGVAGAVRDSSSTYGLRFAGDKPMGKIKLGYSASYATQSDYADNPLSFDLDYFAGEISATFKQYTLGVGTEQFEGNGVKGFTTPLATLHKFNGWADKFLTTPANGLEDKYVNLGATLKGVGPLDTLGFVLSFHDYDAQHITSDYGDEWNASIAAKIKRVNLLLKYADFQQGHLATARDTAKMWAQVEFIW